MTSNNELSENPLLALITSFNEGAADDDVRTMVTSVAQGSSASVGNYVLSQLALCASSHAEVTAGAKKRAFDEISGYAIGGAVSNIAASVSATKKMISAGSFSEGAKSLQGKHNSEVITCEGKLIEHSQLKYLSTPETVKQGFYIVIKNRDGLPMSLNNMNAWECLTVDSKTSISVPSTLIEEKSSKRNSHVLHLLPGNIYRVSDNVSRSTEICIIAKLSISLTATKGDKATLAQLELNTDSSTEKWDLSKLLFTMKCDPLETGMALANNPHIMIDSAVECTLYCFRFVITTQQEFGRNPGVVEGHLAPCDEERKDHYYRFVNICGIHSYQNTSGYYMVALVPNDVPHDKLGAYIAGMTEQFPFDKEVTKDIFGTVEKTSMAADPTYTEGHVQLMRQQFHIDKRAVMSLAVFVSAQALGTIGKSENNNPEHISVKLYRDMNSSESGTLSHDLEKKTLKSLWAPTQRGRTPPMFAPYAKFKTQLKRSFEQNAAQFDMNTIQSVTYFTNVLEEVNRIGKTDLKEQMTSVLGSETALHPHILGAVAAISVQNLLLPTVQIKYERIKKIPFQVVFSNLQEFLDKEYSGDLLCHIQDENIQVKDFDQSNLVVDVFFAKLSLISTDPGLNLAHVVICILKFIVWQYNMPSEENKKQINLYNSLLTLCENLLDKFEWNQEMSSNDEEYTATAVILHVFLTIIRTLDYLYCVQKPFPVICWGVSGYNRSNTVEGMLLGMKAQSPVKHWTNAKIDGSFPLKFCPSHVIMILAGWNSARTAADASAINCFDLSGDTLQDAKDFINHVAETVQVKEYHPMYSDDDVVPERTFLANVTGDDVYTAGDDAEFSIFTKPANWGIPGKLIDHGDVPLYERVSLVERVSMDGAGEGAAA